MMLVYKIIVSSYDGWHLPLAGNILSIPTFSSETIY